MTTTIMPKIKDETYAELPEQPADTLSPVFDFTRGDFTMAAGRVTLVRGEARVRTWIDKVLRTERDLFAAYLITPEKYGVDYQRWLFSVRDRDYIREELGREIRERMLENPEITEVREMQITFDRRGVTVSYRVGTIYGETEGETSGL